MLQFDEYKVKLNNLAPTLEELGKALDLESAERELDMLQAESAADGFWNNLEMCIRDRFAVAFNELGLGNLVINGIPSYVDMAADIGQFLAPD